MSLSHGRSTCRVLGTVYSTTSGMPCPEGGAQDVSISARNLEKWRSALDPAALADRPSRLRGWPVRGRAPVGRPGPEEDTPCALLPGGAACAERAGGLRAVGPASTAHAGPTGRPAAARAGAARRGLSRGVRRCGEDDGAVLVSRGCGPCLCVRRCGGARVRAGGSRECRPARRGASSSFGVHRLCISTGRVVCCGFCFVECYSHAEAL